VLAEIDKLPLELNFMYLHSNSNQEVEDKHFTLKCPHCSNIVSITAISIPEYKLLARYLPPKVGIGYKCNGCNEPIFLKFRVSSYNIGSGFVQIDEKFETVESVKEEFEFEYLQSPVKEDLQEALLCYSQKAYNAFAAMCRRTVQSAAASLGTKGKDKVQRQLEDLREMAQIDDETFSVLKQIIIDGHDGAHPHLPTLSPQRAQILLELIKDVVYQLFVRKAKLEKAADLRKQQITGGR
jgi:hypothetical protein